MFFLDLFITFNGGGGHFNCDLYTICDREMREKGTFTLLAIYQKHWYAEV